VCRHLAWLGVRRSLSELVLEPAHGLLVQSYAPRRQAHGRVNADGWGVGF
jgi:gamma-glutamyl hercynylcysteine S-oxide hydrolase